MNKHSELRLREIETLFRPFRYRKIELASRLVMPAMTRGFATNGVPSPETAKYYRRRAHNGIGLIISEGVAINEAASSSDSHNPDFYGGASLRAWKGIAQAVHSSPCKIAPQLWHVGMARPRSGADLPHPEAKPIGPSGIDPVSLEQTGEPMSLGKISEVIDAFAQGAENAKRLGFDAVELHGAHGYLIDQFFWEACNRRRDEYGGDIIGRSRFACEVIHAVRKAVGRHFPILFRFSQWKIGHYDTKLVRNPAELSDFLKPLCEAGVDIFDCSTRRYNEAEFAGSDLNLAGWVKKLCGKPCICVGSVGLDRPFDASLRQGCCTQRQSLAPLLRRMEAEQFDLIAVGRALLADAEWATKIAQGREDAIIPFRRDCLQSLN